MPWRAKDTSCSVPKGLFWTGLLELKPDKPQDHGAS